MRSFLQTLGLLLITVGIFLWLAHPGRWFRTNAPQATREPLPVIAPPVEKKLHRHVDHVPPRPQQKTLSTTVLLFTHPAQTNFEVKLHKEGGWYETRIPITADIQLAIWCYKDTVDASMCTRQDEVMVGGTVFPLLKASGAVPALFIQTIPSDVAASTYTLTPSNQTVAMPESALQTLKFRAVGDSSPDELHYMVKIQVRPLDQSQPQLFTAAQQREQNELANWGRNDH